jgi:hypothetical protein
VKAKSFLQESLDHGYHGKAANKEIQTLNILLAGILRRRRQEDQSDFENPPPTAETPQHDSKAFQRKSPGIQRFVIFAIISGVAIFAGQVYTNSLDQNRKIPSQPDDSTPDGKVRVQSSGVKSKRYPAKKWQKRRRRWAARKNRSVAGFIRRLIIICMTIATFSVPVWYNLVLWRYFET